MYQAALIRDGTITSHQHIISDRLPEHLDLQDIGDDFFCLPVNIWMYQCNIIVTRDDISQR
jgi:hypothetical protein